MCYGRVGLRLSVSFSFVFHNGNIREVWNATKPAVGFIQSQKDDAFRPLLKDRGTLVFGLSYFSTGAIAADKGTPRCTKM